MNYAARVLTFHIDESEIGGLIEALDEESERLVAECPSFGGLLCLEEDGPRRKVTIISLWDAVGLEATTAQADAARRHIAATTDLGVSSLIQRVVRFVPGASQGAREQMLALAV